MYYTKHGRSSLDPQEDDTKPCPECDRMGGRHITYDDGWDEWEECENCRGKGILDYYGNPI